MTLVLREPDVRAALDMSAVIDAVEAAMRELGRGTAQNQPRRRVTGQGGLLNVMFASYPAAGVYGVKSYSIGSSGVHFLVLLYSGDGSLEALVEADTLGAFRTGAATAVAVRALRGAGPADVAIIGTGHQAETQVMALANALDVGSLRVYSRTAERREEFARLAAERLQLHAKAVPTAREAVEGADVVVCMTTSREPVLEAGWVRDGAVVVGAGSNYANRAELPPDLFADAFVLVDQLEAARLESGDLHAAVGAGTFQWDRANELGALLAGKIERPAHARVSVFESHGLALWDVAAAVTVVGRARREGLGQELSLFG